MYEQFRKVEKNEKGRRPGVWTNGSSWEYGADLSELAVSALAAAA